MSVFGNPLIASLLGGKQSPFTPGINPGAANPQQAPQQNVLDKFLNKPGGSFLMNLLAQQGFSTTPHSPLGAIGKAGLMTQQQQAAKQQSELQRQLIESQIGVNKHRTSTGGTESPFGKIDPSKFTADSLKEFERTGQVSSLRPLVGGQDLNPIINEIADDAERQSKEFVTQKAAVDRIRAVGSEPSAAGDLALIFSFMKLQDPGSTVREGEFANAQNAGGTDDKIRSLYNRVLNGQRLSDPQRADFLSTSTKVFNSAAQNQIERNERLRARAKNQGLSDDIIDPLLVPAELLPVLQSMSNEQLEAIANQGANSGE